MRMQIFAVIACLSLGNRVVLHFDHLAGFPNSQSPFFVKCIRKMAECKHAGQASRPHTIGAHRSIRRSCAAQKG